MDIVSDILQRFWIMFCLFRDCETVCACACVSICICVCMHGHVCKQLNYWWVISNLCCFLLFRTLKVRGSQCSVLGPLSCSMYIFFIGDCSQSHDVDTMHILTTPKFIIQSWFASWSSFFYIQQEYILYIFLDVW